MCVVLTFDMPSRRFISPPTNSIVSSASRCHRPHQAPSPVRYHRPSCSGALEAVPWRRLPANSRSLNFSRLMAEAGKSGEQLINIIKSVLNGRTTPATFICTRQRNITCGVFPPLFFFLFLQITREFFHTFLEHCFSFFSSSWL